MSRSRIVAACAMAAALGRAAPARAQAPAAPPQPPPPSEAAPPPAQPPPVQAPPAPPAAEPPAPPPQAQAPAPAPAPLPAVTQGQWVYTQQYGWVWMTYDDGHVYVPPNGTGEPLEYVYYPAYGWTWIVAPWVWGIGPWPYFGPHPPRVFAWYRHGWWRTPQRWHYRPVPARAGVSARGIRPAPARVGERRERGEHDRPEHRR